MIAQLKSRFQKEVCPYCFEEYRLRETPFRCSSPASRCALEVDEVRKRCWEEGTPLGRVLDSGGKLVHQMRCPECSQITRKRICPHCHMELPHTTGKFENLIFSVIGAKESGKSHYIAVLIDQIRQDVGPGMDMLLEPLDDTTVKRYREAFHDPLFRNGTVIQLTHSALANRQVQIPLVYSLTFGGRGPFGGRRITKAVTLVFFDTAGEDLKDENTMATVNKYIYRSDGIILLLDPLQLSWVRDQLGNGTPLPSENTETSDIITRVSRLILNGRDLAPDAMVPIPLAVAFSKFDAVEPLVDPQLQLNAEPHHDGAFDTADFSAVDAEMRSLLAQWDSDFIPHQVKTRFKRFGFFGLSALGCNPHGDQKVPRVFPRRVEDPFLWLLYRHGLVPAADEPWIRFQLRTQGTRVAVWFLVLALVLILLFVTPRFFGDGASVSAPSPAPTASPSAGPPEGTTSLGADELPRFFTGYVGLSGAPSEAATLTVEAAEETDDGDRRLAFVLNTLSSQIEGSAILDAKGFLRISKDETFSVSRGGDEVVLRGVSGIRGELRGWSR
jgi:hypothetical protein